MNSPTLWLLCLLGLALLNQGLGRPNIEEEDYPKDGEGDDYDADVDEYVEESGPPPVMKSQSEDFLKNVGDVILLPCVVEGNANMFSRIWRKDGNGLYVGTVKQSKDPRINSLANGTLEIRQIEASDAGTYTCMISITGKPQEVAYNLQVRSPAQIVSFVPSQSVVSVKQGHSLTLECRAQGYPTPSVKLFRNDHILENQDPSIHGARYTIENASVEDAGMYKCTATNGQQEVPDARSIEVQVHYPPQIKIASGVVPTGEGYESELVCTVTGSKKPELKWYKDGEAKAIVSSDRIKLERSGHDHILRILKTQQSDFGDYVCEAKNHEGEISAVIHLTGRPARPIVESAQSTGESKDPVLKFKIESYAPIEEYELLYKQDIKDEWISVKPKVVSPPEGRFFSLTYTLTGLEPGVYQAQLKAKNSYGWSEFSSMQTFAKEHAGDLTETGLLAISDNSASSELRISLALLVSLVVAHFYC